MYIIYSEKNIKYRKLEKRIKKIMLNILDSIKLSNSIIEKLKNTDDQIIKAQIEKSIRDKEIFKYNIEETIKYVLKAKNKNIQETNIFFIIKQYKSEYKNILLRLAKECKSINIVTNNIKSFDDFVEEIYNQYGIYVVISNNKRKSLLKADYVVNMDNSEKELNEYNINRYAIIFNTSINLILNIRGLDGIIISNIKVKTKNSKKNFIKRRFNENLNEKIQKIVLIGNNGYISWQELTK